MAQTTQNKEGTQNIERRRVKEGEITLVDVVWFFRSNWKFLVLLALVLSVITVTMVALLLPHWQYRKQLTLSVRPVPSELVGQIEEQGPGLNIQDMSPEEAGKLAVGYLSSEGFSQVEVEPAYRPDTQQVQVNLQAEDRDSLGGVGSKAVDSVKVGFQELYENALSAGLEARTSTLEREIESNREIMAQLEQEIEQLSSGGTEDAGTAARLEGLETKRADVSANRTWAENQLGYLEQAREDLPQFATEPIAVDTLSEPDTERQLSRSFVASILLAVISSFILAAIVTVIRAALRRGK